MSIKMLKKTPIFIIITTLLFLAAVVYFFLAKKSSKNIFLFHDISGKPFIEEQIKFDIPNMPVFEKLKNMDNILSYRSKFKGSYNYQDYYYDTPNLDLFKLGYAYRLRIRDYGEGNLEYGIQFKKEYEAKNVGNFTRSEVDDVISEDTAKDMLSPDFSAVFLSNHDFSAINKLRVFLEDNKIDHRQLAPFLYCQQKRERLRLYEHSVFYFEISLDDVLFNLVKGADKKQIRFFQLEFENKLKGAISGNSGRIDKLIKFFTSNYLLKINRDSKYRKAVLELTGK